jgi:peptidoglycan hydrolase CwlO-like protein
MRRPAHLRVNVGRSTGVAEHHFRTVLTRFNVTRLVAVACIGALGLLPAIPAHAATAGDQIATTTQAIDAAAQKWFAAQADAARIDADIADVEHQIAAAEARMENTRKLATARAVILYKNADAGFTSMFGSTALDSARRAHLADDANAGGNAAIARLTAAVDDLNAQRRSLEAQKAEQHKVLLQVASERASLDAQLAGVRAQAQRAARVALAAAGDRAARLLADAHAQALATPRTNDTTSAPTGPPSTAPVSAVIVVTPPSNTQASSHHDDPFLVCTRDRESRGQYDVVSASGLYYGAYQFLPSTWDSTAVHAGRNNLVGVLPSRASQFDQDELAWVLYQWQGKAPWGGRC